MHQDDIYIAVRGEGGLCNNETFGLFIAAHLGQKNRILRQSHSQKIDKVCQYNVKCASSSMYGIVGVTLSPTFLNDIGKFVHRLK